MLATALVLTTIAVTACGPGVGAATGDSTATGLSAQTQEAVEAAYKGIFGEPPKGQRFAPSVDYEAAYRKAWGVD